MELLPGIISVLCVVFLDIKTTLAESEVYRAAVEGHSARGWYREAGVAADSEICGKVAVDILRRNGSVVDAGVASQLCNGVVDQIHMGIGGGAVSLVYESPNDNPTGPKELVYISGESSAPAWVEERSLYAMDLFAPLWMKTDPTGRVVEWQPNMMLAIGLPGEIAGYYAAWERYGRLPWYEVVKPALDLAQNGWEVTPMMAKVLFEFTEKVKSTASLRFFKKELTPGFYVPNMYGAGDKLTDPKLAQSLHQIAHHGPDAFYNGALADMIIEDIKQLGGKVTKQDLQDKKPRFHEAIRIPLHGGKYIAYFPPSPYSGPMIAIAYNIIAGYNMTVKDLSSKEGLALFYHRLVETWKLTMSHTNCIGEDFYMLEECKEINHHMSSMEYADQLRSRISDDAAYQDHDHYSMLTEQEPVEQHGTSHLSMIGPNGAVFSSTSTVNIEFGCGAKGEQSGIVFNNALTDFYRKRSLEGKEPKFHAGKLRAGKMPGSMRSPVLVTDMEGNVVTTMGASGGVRIPMAITQDLLFHLHFGLDLQGAIDYPRVCLYNYNGYPTFYDTLDEEIIDILKSKGHKNLDYYFPSFPYTGVVQAVSTLKCHQCTGTDCTEDCIEAVSDHRKMGVPSGF